MVAAANVERIRKVQNRINEALRESPPHDTQTTKFSEYLDADWPDLEDRFERAATLRGGIEGVEAALDEFDRMYAKENRGRLRHAFMVFMTHNKHVAELGLRTPSLEERSSWKLLSSKRGGVINNNNSTKEPQESHGHS